MRRETFIRKVNQFGPVMLTALIGLACLSAFAVHGFGQLNRNHSNTDAGSLVDAFIRRKMASEQIPGVQIAVLRNGKLVKAANYGVSNVELNSPVTSETMFEIASNSKQFTACAIFLLCQDKRLSLDDSIAKYIKGLSREYDPVTIRHLLNHTSGVKDYIEEFDLDRRLDYTNRQLIERIGANKLNFAAGENARYSTTGYLLLGIIIESITGKPYGEFLQERIFGPLGMKHTRVNGLSEIIPGRATGYILDNGKLRHGRYVAQSLRASADIGLMTTATDMAKWDSALNSSKIFTRNSLDIMFAPGRLRNGDLARNEWNGYFGAGWFIDDYLGNREIDHGGTLITGFHCNISRFVDKNLTVIVLTNRLRSDPSMLGYSIAGFYDTSLRPPHMIVPTPDRNLRQTGRIGDLLAKIANVSVDDSNVTLGFKTWLSSENGPKDDIKDGFSGRKPLTFIKCSVVSGHPIERIGSQISSICIYRLNDGPKNHYVTVYLDPNEKLADVWIYSNTD